MSEEQKKKLSIQMTGRKVAPDVVARRAATQTGQKRSQETKDKIRAALIGKLKGPMSEENKLRISIGAKGIKKTETHSSNVRNAVLGNISINKDNVEKKIKNEELQLWLAQGWQLGGRKRI